MDAKVALFQCEMSNIGFECVKQTLGFILLFFCYDKGMHVRAFCGQSYERRAVFVWVDLK